MEIKYFKNGETTIARGFSNGCGPEGIPAWLYFAAAYNDYDITSKERAMLLSSAPFTTKSSPKGADTYDERVGMEIARDKTVLKNCKREMKQLAIIKKFMEKTMANVERRISICERKMRNAEERMSNR